MDPNKCSKYSGPDRNADMDPKLSEFITFLVVVPLALFAIISHNSPMKPFFVLISSLLISQFLTSFDAQEIMNLSIEIAKMITCALEKAKDYLLEIKDRFMEHP